MAETTQSPNPPFRAGYVAILGRPNAGKSTLLNALVGQKLAAVTDKPQTTRNRISGILTTDTAQFVFLDTPGVIEPRYRLQRIMVQTAMDCARNADLTLYLLDVTRRSHDEDDAILQRLPKSAPLLLALNKADKIHKPLLLPMLEKYGELGIFRELVPLSAKTGDGLPRLLEVMEGSLPESPLLFPADQLSDLPERFFAGETIREKVFLLTRQEVPYASSVVIEEFVVEANQVFIRAAIFVERPSQKGILIGEKGAMLTRIGQESRLEIEAFLGTRVFLELWIGVRENWRENVSLLRDFGYEA